MKQYDLRVIYLRILESFIHHRVVEHYLQFNFNALTCRLRAEGHIRLLYSIILSTDIWIETLRHIKLRESISSSHRILLEHRIEILFTLFFSSSSFLVPFSSPFFLFLPSLSFFLAGAGEAKAFCPTPIRNLLAGKLQLHDIPLLFFTSSSIFLPFISSFPFFFPFPSFLLSYFVLLGGGNSLGGKALSPPPPPPDLLLPPFLFFFLFFLSLSLLFPFPSFSLSLSLSFAEGGGGQGPLTPAGSAPASTLYLLTLDPNNGSRRLIDLVSVTGKLFFFSITWSNHENRLILL